MKTYTIKEFGDKINMSPSTIRNWVECGEIVPEFVTPGGHRRFTQKQIDDFNQKVLELPTTAKPIEDAINHWVDIDGEVYALSVNRSTLFKKSQTTTHGYRYCGIMYKDGVKSKRVHRLVANAHIDNPFGLTVVGHKNNIKNDNRVENLYWTTISENTQKAVDDGLMKNDKGFDDSQSMPVKRYCTFTNELLGTYGSIIEAHKATGISKSTIARQCKYKRPVRKETYFRYIDDPDNGLENQNITYQYDYNTDELIGQYYNIKEASRKTGINEKTIAYQFGLGRKPHTSNQHGCYFLNVKL